VKRYGNRCARCDARGVKLTLDHKIPLVRGGTWKIANLQLLCERGNSKKADRMPWDFHVPASGEPVE
jgi:5-methylcytosine-specific restriction endonuclease McrA